MTKKNKLDISGVCWSNNVLLTNTHFVALTLNQKSFDKLIKRMNVPLDQHPTFVGSGADASTTFLKKDNHDCAIVSIKDYKNHSKIQLYALLTHEAVHIFDDITLKMGERSPSSEFKAYSIQSIAQELFESYRLLTKKKKK